MFFSKNSMCGEDRIILDYNGERYVLERGDLPGVGGSATITVVNRPGHQYQSISEGLEGDLIMRQVNGRGSINGVDLAKLVKRCKARRRK
jgi:hypothetical protein